MNRGDAEEAITGLVQYVQKTNAKLSKGWDRLCQNKVTTPTSPKAVKEVTAPYVERKLSKSITRSMTLSKNE